MPDPRVLRRIWRGLEPAAGGDDVIAPIAVDITDPAAVAHADVFRPQHVLLKPRRLVDMLEPDEAAAWLSREVVHQHILFAVAGEIADHHPFNTVGLEQRVRIPL